MLENNETTGQLLTFSCGESVYAFDIMNVQDIIEIPEITPLPMVDDYICGIMNLRGKVVPVMDFAGRMKFAASVYDNHSCIAVIECDGSPLGVKIERVLDAEIYDKDRLIPSPVENSCVSGYIQLGERRITVIDCIKFAAKI